MCGSLAIKSLSKQNINKKRATSFRTQGVVTRSQNKENIPERIVRPRAYILY